MYRKNFNVIQRIIQNGPITFLDKLQLNRFLNQIQNSVFIEFLIMKDELLLNRNITSALLHLFDKAS